MFQIAKPLFFICETPLHAGSGSDLGVVDLPIQREKHTSFPKIESSSFKGAMREAFRTRTKATKLQIEALFGPEEGGNEGHMGALGFSDARLLLFPVKSMKGVFAWITCPKVLDQFKRDMKITDDGFDINGDYSVDTEGGKCKLMNNTSNLRINNKDNILLEEYAFETSEIEWAEGAETLQDWFAENLPTEWKDKIKKDIVILSDDDFKDFVNLSTEVITRTKIQNDTGTVQPGALFTEEFLPAESVMYSLIMASPVFKKEIDKGEFALTKEEKEETDEDKKITEADKVMNKFKNIIQTDLIIMQIGGNATLGKGIVRTKII
jgi:CRISPR-associated protein Cmr4